MNCVKCHQPLTPGARFCGTCGQRIDNPSAPQAGGPSRFDNLAHAGGPGGASGAGSWSGSGSAGAGGVDSESTTVRSASAGGAGSGTAGGGIDASGLISRITGIVLKPRAEWPVIAAEDTSAMEVLTRYVAPLVGVAALLSFVRMSIIGVSVPFAGTIRSPISTGLAYMVFTLVMGMIGVCLLAAIINALAPTFGGQRNWRQAIKAAAYSLTPAYLSSLLVLLPAFGTLLSFLAGLYGIYVLYLGLPVVMSSKPDKATGYTAATVVCTIILGVILGSMSTVAGIGMGRGIAGLGVPRDHDVANAEDAAVVANVIGNALGTDNAGKAGLSSALSNMVKAGEQVEAQQRAARSAAASGSASSAGADPDVSSLARAITGSGSANASGSVTGTPGASGAGGTGAGAAGSAEQNPVAAVGGLLTALGGAMGGATRHQPVPFQTLKDYLPAAVGGLSRTNAEGSAKQAMGVQGTSATGTYQGGNGARIEIHIADMTGVAGLMDLADSFGTEETHESDTGYEKTIALGGRTVHEKYDHAGKHGTASVILAKRFSVEVTGDGVDMATLEQSLSEVNLAGLEGMRDVGAVK